MSETDKLWKCIGMLTEAFNNLGDAFVALQNRVKALEQKQFQIETLGTDE